MNANSQRPSAKILPFVRKSPAKPAARDTKPRDERPTWPAVEFGSGWYHDAAIQAETARKP